jgi:hypothetical protein
MRVLALGLATALFFSSAPLGAFAQRHGGGGGGGNHGGGGGGGGNRGGGQAPPAHVNAPQVQPPRQAGFDLHEDIGAPHGTAPSHMNVPGGQARPGYAGRPAAPVQRPALIGRLGYGGQPQNHRVINNPRYNGGSWGWNRGVVWNPAPRYWGGGFWGPFALGVIAAAAYGSIYYDDGTIDSYQVEPDTPGAELLESYQLTQVPCGPPDIVVIFGPDDSVICAQPNDLVAPGEYQLDPSTLTIVSLQQ